MRKTIGTLTAMMIGLSVATFAGQNGGQNDVKQDKRDAKQDRRDLRSDKKDVRRDTRDIRKDKVDLAADKKAGDKADAKQDYS